MPQPYKAGGGITIYKQFLSHLPKYIGQNKYWIFINPVLPKVAIEGVTYISFPLQSKLKRILFEGKLLQNEIVKLGVKPDVVVSLQNNGYKKIGEVSRLFIFISRCRYIRELTILSNVQKECCLIISIFFLA